VSWVVSLLGVELTSVAQADKLNGISDGSRPIEALPEGVSNKGPGRRMVATSL